MRPFVINIFRSTGFVQLFQASYADHVCCELNWFRLCCINFIVCFMYLIKTLSKLSVSDLPQIPPLNLLPALYFQIEY